jgi:hypothetical protein
MFPPYLLSNLSYLRRDEQLPLQMDAVGLKGNKEHLSPEFALLKLS